MVKTPKAYAQSVARQANDGRNFWGLEPQRKWTDTVITHCAPKIRAMQIISELEGTTRGPYAGCVGYFSFNGNLDTCITIRTALLKDGKAYVQAGGGWVNDSEPEAEFQETVNKSKAMLKAVALAETFAKTP